jgi:hypothetical protein
MTRSLLVLAAFGAFASACAAAPIYFVDDGRAAPSKQGVAILFVRGFDDGEAGACTRAQMQFRSSTPKRCARQLPDSIAPILHDQPVAKAYVIKVVTPQTPGATYTLRYGMSMRSPPDVCKNLVDYEKRYSSAYVLKYGRITCTMPL